MTLVDLLLIVLLIGLLLSIFNWIPMDYRIRQILYVIVGIVLIIWILGLLGIVPRNHLIQ